MKEGWGGIRRKGFGWIMRGVAPGVAPFAVVMLLVGCGLTPQGNAVRNTVQGVIAKAGEGGLVNAENLMCELAPVGAVNRRYGVTVEKSEAYKAICKNTSTSDVIRP